MVTAILIIIAILIIAIIFVGIKINHSGKIWNAVYIILGAILLIGLYYAWRMPILLKIGVKFNGLYGRKKVLLVTPIINTDLEFYAKVYIYL